MILTPKQIEHVNKEREILRRVIEEKERDKVYTGIGWDRNRLHIIQTIIELHNLEIKNDKRNSVPVEKPFGPDNPGYSFVLSFGC